MAENPKLKPIKMRLCMVFEVESMQDLEANGGEISGCEAIGQLADLMERIKENWNEMRDMGGCALEPLSIVDCNYMERSDRPDHPEIIDE
jgi:hypothetical protein